MISQFHERRRANRETWLLAHGLYVYLFINFYTHSRSESLTFSRYHPGSLTDNWCRRTPLCCSEGWRQLWRIYHGCRRKQKSGMFNWFFFPFIIISWQNEILSSEASVLGTILWWRWGFFLNYVPWSKTQKKHTSSSSHTFPRTTCVQPDSRRRSTCQSFGLVFIATSVSKNADKHYQEDSLNLWRQLCSNRLLAAANLIVFFNKVRSFSFMISWNMNWHSYVCTHTQKDVLASTLASGVQVKQFVPSYGNLSNEITQVTKCQADIPYTLAHFI